MVRARRRHAFATPRSGEVLCRRLDESSSWSCLAADTAALVLKAKRRGYYARARKPPSPAAIFPNRSGPPVADGTAARGPKGWTVPSTGTPCGAAHPPLAATIGCAVTMALEPAGAEQPRRWRTECSGLHTHQPSLTDAHARVVVGLGDLVFPLLSQRGLTVTDDDALIICTTR
jgi:hypothetical protein